MQQPLINGNLYGHTSLTCMVDALQYYLTGLKELTYTQKCDPGKAYGTSPYMLGRTSGQIEASGSMTLIRQEADMLRTELGIYYMQKPFDVSCTYEEPNVGTVTDRLVGIRITSEENSSSSGNEPIHV